MSDFSNNGERVEGAGGLSIFFRSLRPKQEPRAVVIIVPGFNAHSGYYAWVAEQDGLSNSGYRCGGTRRRNRGHGRRAALGLHCPQIPRSSGIRQFAFSDGISI
jgi:alpha-beta hydrolase superfamily lysophospholipase